mmetsp:Transcript_7965/g.10183  ORF Transcript_7965/g.10183 Transcript_7965/m.10183 type:complete len:383 (+) Transcript_7965:261-1409(+)
MSGRKINRVNKNKNAFESDHDDSEREEAYSLSISKAIAMYGFRPSDFKGIPFQRQNKARKGDSSKNKWPGSLSTTKYFRPSDCEAIALRIHGEDSLKFGFQSTKLSSSSKKLRRDSDTNRSTFGSPTGSILEVFTTPPSTSNMSGRVRKSVGNSVKFERQKNESDVKKSACLPSGTKLSLDYEKGTRFVDDFKGKRINRADMRECSDDLQPAMIDTGEGINKEDESSLKRKRDNGSKQSVDEQCCTCKWTEITAVFHLYIDETHLYISEGRKNPLSYGEKAVLKNLVKKLQVKVREKSLELLENRNLAKRARAAMECCQKLRDASVDARTCFRRAQGEFRFLQKRIKHLESVLEKRKTADHTLRIIEYLAQAEECEAELIDK